MATGLLGGVLPYIYSKADALKRTLGDVVSNPMASVEQTVNYANDRAGNLNRLLSQVSSQGIRGLSSPQGQELADLYAQGYNPVGMTSKNVGKSSFEYMASHRPVTIEGGASTLDNLIPSFGEDIYGKKALQYFGTGSPNLDRQALSVFRQVKGNPNATVTVYRAVPKNVEQQSLNSGDWVTISRDYAKQHGESTLGGNYKLVEQQVPASSLTTNADSILEQGYYPKTTVETSPTFTDPFANTIGSSIR